MRRFYLVRQKDVSGVSGCGIVAEGIEWSDGSATMHWLGDHGSHDSQANAFDGNGLLTGIDIMTRRHGHDGAGVIVYADQLPLEELLLKATIFGNVFTIHQHLLHTLQAYVFDEGRSAA